jgi:hypothetical protein
MTTGLATTGEDSDAPPADSGAGPWWARAVVFVIAGGSIAALLADLFAVAPMHLVFWAASVPSMVLLAILVGWRGGSPNRWGSLLRIPAMPEDLRRRIRVGAFGGLLGTLGYDVVRVPFALAGQRLFAPIDSYGILIADAYASSGWTATLGWLYHLSNGVTFGIAYAAIAARRPWIWGVAWGLLLESVAVFSPFAVRYAIAGHVAPIVTAYLAHVFYGYPLGRVVQNLDAADEGLRRWGRRSVAVLLVAASLAIVGWHRPWDRTPAEAAAVGLGTPGRPAAVVRLDRFEPEWLRVRAGGCVLIDNRSDRAYATPFGRVEAAAHSMLCFDRPGAYRVTLGSRPYSGGFVYVDR